LALGSHRIVFYYRAVTTQLHNSALTERLLAASCRLENEMADLLCALVAIPTENPPGSNYRACSTLLEQQLRALGLECERYEPRDDGLEHPSPETERQRPDSPVILTASYGQGDRALYFHGHYDVVPAQSPAQFRPERKQHFVFGRGSCDMKGGIVAMLFAIRALRECSVTLNGRIVLTLVPDEETGGAHGSVWLAAQRLLGRNAIGMLLPEPTSGVIWHANRGAITLRVKVLGQSAHVGLQHQGENAFEQMLRVAARLQELKRDVEQRATAYDIGTEQSRNSILMLGGQSGGGANFNVVPEECWFTLDRRINPEEDLATEKARLLSVLQKCKDEGIPLQWGILQEGHSAASEKNDPLGRGLARSVQAVTGSPPSFEMCPGLLETRFYAAQGIPAHAYGPGLLSVAHGPNEYVDLRKICDCVAIYALTAAEMLSA
jgi:succinyl-diaminopimelate desuccinylase